MFCPRCGDEYQQGIERCPDCGVALVLELPKDPEPSPFQPVTVLTTGDPLRIEMVKAALDSAGIDYWVRGQGLQDLMGGGRLGTGYSVAFGPARVDVDPENEADARRIIEGAEPFDDGGPPESADGAKCTACGAPVSQESEELCPACLEGEEGEALRRSEVERALAKVHVLIVFSFIGGWFLAPFAFGRAVQARSLYESHKLADRRLLWRIYLATLLSILPLFLWAYIIRAIFFGS
jgi:predicted  nucleic acid-binding Zn-ribbon protein